MTSASTAQDCLCKAKEGYRGRSVLITGADGFIGSHLTDTLVNWGAEVSVLVHQQPEKLKYISRLEGKIDIYPGDVGDYDQVLRVVETLLDSEKPLIFHLAAHTHVGESWQHPEETLRTNIIGTLNVLWAVHANRLALHCFSYTGSSEEYGGYDDIKAAFYQHQNGGKILLNETSPLNPKSIYATSKVAADFLSRNFYDAYGIPAVISRMFNNFGPRQSARFITGTVITQALERETVEIGWPHSQRDFTYIQDGVHGLLLSALYGKPGQVYVFGQGKNSTIGDWAQLILDVGETNNFWPARRLVTTETRFRPGHTDETELLADSARLQELCDWQPRVDWRDGILNTIRWYAENRGIWQKQIDWQ